MSGHEQPTPREILAATEVIAAAARADMLPVAAFQIVGQIRLWVRLNRGRHGHINFRGSGAAAQGNRRWPH
jgi:hypothetical protein